MVATSMFRLMTAGYCTRSYHLARLQIGAEPGVISHTLWIVLLNLSLCNFGAAAKWS